MTSGPPIAPLKPIINVDINFDDNNVYKSAFSIIPPLHTSLDKKPMKKFKQNTGKQKTSKKINTKQAKVYNGPRDILINEQDKVYNGPQDTLFNEN